jgi:hypothetical protein
MTESNRDRLIELIGNLTDQQIEALLGVVQVFQAGDKPLYDRSRDVAIGLFEGPEDLSERAEDILEEEVKRRGSWTLKDPE